MRSLHLAVALLLLLLPLRPLAPASAHEHPNGSIDRVTPGAVRVEAAAHVEITLVDDRSQAKNITRSYDVALGGGSGFTVSPDGIIVTATQTVTSDDDPLVYAANKIFGEYFKQSLPADFARHSASGADLDFRLQNCYPPKTSLSICFGTVTRTVKVFPNTDPVSSGGLPATIVRAGSAPEQPAIVRLDKSDGTLPTVPLAAEFGPTKAGDLMAFKGGRPAATNPVSTDTLHFDPPGSQSVLGEDREKVGGLLGNGAVGAAVVDDTKSEVVGIASGTAGNIKITKAQDIQKALKEAGVQARRGPVDVVFETALAQYHDRFYSLSIPVLEQVLKLRPDHAVAIDHLRNARAWRGTDKEAKRPSDAASGGIPLVNAWTVSAATLLVASLAAGILLLRRPKGAPAAAGPAGL
ncbi:hypothetical protein, partial [Actinocorallia lasiicapitis]